MVGESVVECSDIGASSTGPLELRTSLWALAGRPSLGAKVTSMKSAVHDERCSDFFFRNSALRLAFLLIAEGLFLFTALAAGARLSLVSRENAKVEPMVSEKVKDLFWLTSAWQKSMHWEAKEESTAAIFLVYLNQENEGAGQRYMLPPCLLKLNLVPQPTMEVGRGT